MTDETDWLDENEYPTDAALERIGTWECKDHETATELLKFVRSLWMYPEYFQKFDEHRYSLVTGGWSGNESIIGALQTNPFFWALCWQKSERGGLHEFKLPGAVELEKRLGDKDYMRTMAVRVKQALPDNHGFLLLTYPFGDDPNGKVTYTATCNREDGIKLLKEFLFKIGQVEDWMQHVK